LTPIDIKTEETAQLYQLTRGSRKEETMFDQDMGVKHWLHPAVKVTTLQDNEDNSTTQIFTNGSKSEQGVGAGIAVYRSGTHTKSLKYRLNKKCTNNKAERLAILKSLEYTENIQQTSRSPYTLTAKRLWTHSKTTTTHIPHRKNKTESDGVATDRMENPFLLGQGTRRDPRKRTH
jgi:hypothetical protein